MTLALLLALAAPDLGRVGPFALADAAGRPRTPAEWKEAKAVVLVFLGTECPVSNFYAPAVEQLARDGAARGVLVWGVYPDPDVTPADARGHAAEYKLTLTTLLDPAHALTGPAGVTRVPEAVVLTPDGTVRYRGRIDDRFGRDGKRRQEPSKRELADAIDAVLAGRDPTPATTPAFGCPVPKPRKTENR